MKIFAISDLHLSINNPKPMDIFGPTWDNYFSQITEDWSRKVGADDIVLLCGDFSWAMYLNDAISDFKSLSHLNGKKIIIRGNHDYWWKSISAVRSILPTDFYAIQNDAMKIGDKVICGTRGWQVPDGEYKSGSNDDKLYKRESLRLELTLESAKRLQTNNEEIICMMHYPPFNYKKEDSEFTKLIEKYDVKTVVFGHLHGKTTIPTIQFKNGVKYYLSSCDLIANQLIEIR